MLSAVGSDVRCVCARRFAVALFPSPFLALPRVLLLACSLLHSPLWCIRSSLRAKQQCGLWCRAGKVTLGEKKSILACIRESPRLDP